MRLDMSQEPFYARISRKMPQTKIATTVLCEPRNAHGHATGAILCENLQVKCRFPKPRQPFCASLLSRNAHGQVTRAILRENLQAKCRKPNSPRRLFASLRIRNAKILRKNAGAQMEHPDQAPALTLPVRTPHTVSQSGPKFI